MHTVKLLNSTVMPNEGIYHCTKVTKNEFFSRLELALREGRVENYVGYQETLDYISSNLGTKYPLTVNRWQATAKAGDELLVIKLKTRVSNQDEKGKVGISDENVEFYLVKVLA